MSFVRDQTNLSMVFVNASAIDVLKLIRLFSNLPLLYILWSYVYWSDSLALSSFKAAILLGFMIIFSKIQRTLLPVRSVLYFRQNRIPSRVYATEIEQVIGSMISQPSHSTKKIIYAKEVMWAAVMRAAPILQNLIFLSPYSSIAQIYRFVSSILLKIISLSS